MGRGAAMQQVHRSMPQTMVASAVALQVISPAFTHALRTTFALTCHLAGKGPSPAEDRMGINASVPHQPGMVAVHLPSRSSGPAAAHPQNQPWLSHQPQQHDLSAAIGHPFAGNMSIGSGPARLRPCLAFGFLKCSPCTFRQEMIRARRMSLTRRPSGCNGVRMR